MWNQKNDYVPTRSQMYYSIGRIKKMYNLGADSLRYYEKKGVFKPMRGNNNYRYYGPREILCLNVLTSLRSVGLSVDRVRDYLQNRTISSSLEMLHDMLDMTEEKIRHFMNFIEEIRFQIRSIEEANDILCDIISVEKLPGRPAFLVDESYVTNEEYDLIRKELTRNYDLPFSVIGDLRIGSATSLQRIQEGDYVTYDCMFMLDKNGSFTIPEGLYLTLSYRGNPQKEQSIRRLIQYAEKNRFRIIGPFIEFCALEIHTSDVPEEWVTVNQVLVEQMD